MHTEPYINVLQSTRGTEIADAMEKYLLDRVGSLAVQLRSIDANDIAKVSYLQGQINGLEEIYMTILSPDITNEGEIDMTNRQKIKYFFTSLFKGVDKKI